MYRQILIHKDDRYLQNIVWRESADRDVSIYELETVTYGTASAPYLAIRCIKKLAEDNKIDHPVASEVIDRDMYVDDLIGFDNECQAIVRCNEISKILKSASFSLRNWASNSKKILEGLEDTSDAFSILELGENDRVKTLGLQWCSHLDILSYKVLDAPLVNSITKRGLLRSIAKISDPLGLVSPCTILAKMLVQRLWSEKLQWDDEIPLDMRKKWEYLHSRLNLLNQLKIPRYCMCDEPVSVELHGFSDASASAYSAVVYVRSTDVTGKEFVHLLCSKTKVAPVKVLIIPRLELCGALILSRLVKQVSDSYICKHVVFYWCDSRVVLSWLKSEANRFQVFVANRVNEIQRLSDITKWSYVNTKSNPADIASRGMHPDELYKNRTWWNGSLFLYERPDWPREFLPIESSEIAESRRVDNILCNVNFISLDMFSRFSSLNKLKRVFAYCLRFVGILKTKVKNLGPLTVLDLEYSIQGLTKLAQRECFGDEIRMIQGNQPLKGQNRLLSLNSFIDSDGLLLRVGGRLKNSCLTVDEKHPMLLDGKHKFTRMIFHAEHLKLHHASPQLLLFSVRKQFWATSGMSVAKLSVRKCVRCFRNKPVPTNSIMADLPKHRVQIDKPFSVTGLDYAGPVILRDRKGRPYKTYKAYICLFICFVSKAVHIELVTDLTSEAFIAAFRRFASRRGTPRHLYSDNGTSFVGANQDNPIKLSWS